MLDLFGLSQRQTTFLLQNDPIPWTALSKDLFEFTAAVMIVQARARPREHGNFSPPDWLLLLDQTPHYGWHVVIIGQAVADKEHFERLVDVGGRLHHEPGLMVQMKAQEHRDNDSRSTRPKDPSHFAMGLQRFSRRRQGYTLWDLHRELCNCLAASVNRVE